MTTNKLTADHIPDGGEIVANAAAIRAAFETDYFADAPPRARERSGDGYKYMAASVAWGTWQRAWAAAHSAQPAAENAALRLVADVRFALGDNGKRMQPELIEWANGLRRDAERYQWLRAQHWNEATLCVVTHPKRAIKPGYDCPSLERLDAAIDAAKGGTQ